MCMQHDLASGEQVQVKFLSDTVARVRVAPPGSEADSLLNRYGFLRESLDDAVKVDRDSDSSGFKLASARMEIRFTAATAALVVTDLAQGRVVLEQVEAASGKPVARARFRAGDGEDWVGFGDQTRERLFHRGHTADLWVRNVDSYIPVPFFMSTRGVGILVNTTHHVVFDMAASEPDYFSWQDQRGVVDYYVMVGEDFRALISEYTALSGRPELPPLWAFGLWYICRTQANDYEAVNDAYNFRREGIPCDVIGLEPGWMRDNYDRSLDKQWSDERFPIPSYCRNGPHNFFNAIKRMGYHFELWLCNEYDLTYEEERRLGRQKQAGEVANQDGSFHAGAEVDEHFESRSPDGLTRPDEPWFEHLKQFVDQGVDFFKQDGAFQVCNHAGRYWGNGRSDEEVHNLYPLLYSRQMKEGFEAHTGRRSVVFTVDGWTGFQALCGTWTGDTGGRLETLGAMLNTSMVGHSWATNDMEVMQPEGIHFGYLQPWSQINSWNYFRMPWVQGRELCDMHRDYAELRARLIPYIYSWAYQATRTGYPLMVPLALEYPDDDACRNVLHEYLLGRDLLVTIYKDDVYFPAGRWKDFWTGEVIEGSRSRKISWPENRGGGLFMRTGAIIPLGPVMQYRGEKPVDHVELWTMPDKRESILDFYEDDGVSFAYRQGEYAITRVRAQEKADEVIVRIEEPSGGFTGQVRERGWSFRVAVDAAPAFVRANGRELAPGAWRFDADMGVVRVDALNGPVELIVGKS